MCNIFDNNYFLLLQQHTKVSVTLLFYSLCKVSSGVSDHIPQAKYLAPIVQVVVVVSLALVQTGLPAVSHEVGSHVLGPKIGEGHRVFDEDCVLFSLGHQGARPAVGKLVDFDRTP